MGRFNVSTSTIFHGNVYILVPSPLHARARKGRTNVSIGNAIFGNSGVRKIETNDHFRTVCIHRAAHTQMHGPRIIITFH